LVIEGDREDRESAMTVFAAAGSSDARRTYSARGHARCSPDLRVRPASNSEVRIGTVVGVHGSVVDLEFDDGLPALHEIVTVDRGVAGSLAIEIQQHADEHTVRGVALAETAGLRRGERARASGQPLEVPLSLAPTSHPTSRSASRRAPTAR
jgi:hypothetical protein